MNPAPTHDLLNQHHTCILINFLFLKEWNLQILAGHMALQNENFTLQPPLQLTLAMQCLHADGPTRMWNQSSWLPISLNLGADQNPPLWDTDRSWDTLDYCKLLKNTNKITLQNKLTQSKTSSWLSQQKFLKAYYEVKPQLETSNKGI